MKDDYAKVITFSWDDVSGLVKFEITAYEDCEVETVIDEFKHILKKMKLSDEVKN